MMLPLFIAQLLFVCGRQDDVTPIYWIDQPNNWSKSRLSAPIDDTTLPLITLEHGSIQITLHNFPLGKSSGIPPIAQVERWKRQLDDWDGHVTPTSHGGFVGLLIEGSGTKDGEELGLIAVAFQLAESSKRQLHYEELYNPNSKNSQRLADVTIKAVGPIDEIKEQRNTILSLIHNFQLVDDIP